MYDVSICLPAIRTPLWIKFYETLKESCKRHSFEVVFVGPFDPPKELNLPNVKFAKSYCRPSSGCQLAVDMCEGELWFNGADDALHVPDGVDQAIDLWRSVGDRKAIVNMRYTEWEGCAGQTYTDPAWWYAHRHPPLQKPSIPGNFRMLLNPLMRVDYFKELGGFDCAYEYQNFNIHDFVFRAQADGAPVFLSPTDVMNCDHYGDGSPMGTADHYPIQTAYYIDKYRFDCKYNNPDALRPDALKIDFDHYKNYMEPWRLRFSEKMYTTYEEMLESRGVKLEGVK